MVSPPVMCLLLGQALIGKPPPSQLLAGRRLPVLQQDAAASSAPLLLTATLPCGSPLQVASALPTAPRSGDEQLA